MQYSSAVYQHVVSAGDSSAGNQHTEHLHSDQPQFTTAETFQEPEKQAELLGQGITVSDLMFSYS
jgi:hypothetical protein